MDLVQIRWQQVRLAEASQVIVRENIELKQKIAQLQIAKSSAKQQPKSSVDTKILENIQTIVLEYTKDLTKRTSIIKQDIDGQKDVLSQFRNTFKEVCNKYELLLREKDSQITNVMRENDSLQEKIATMNRQLTEGDSTRQNEFANLERKLEHLRKENDSLSLKNNDLEKTISSNIFEVTDLKAQRETIQSALLELQESKESLVSTFQRTEEDLTRKLNESEDLRKKLTIDYEKMIEEMSADNQFLRNTIGELEEQIAKLSNSLVGNKSHFAKYVEVKSENIMLQSKLESLSGGKGKVTNFLPQLASGVASNIKDGGIGPGSGRRGSAEHGKVPPTSGKLVPNLPIDRNTGSNANVRAHSGGTLAANPSPRSSFVQSGRVNGNGHCSTKSTQEGLILSARSHDQLEVNNLSSQNNIVRRPHQPVNAHHGAKSNEKMII